MHLVETVKDRDQMCEKPPFGAGFPRELAEKADHMEWWGSSFDDPGDDYNEYKLVGANGQVIATKRVAGY
jgi:hypothetical protein